MPACRELHVQLVTEYTSHEHRVWYYNTSGQSQLYSKCNIMYVHIIIMIRDLNRKLTRVTDLQFYSCGVDNISPSTLTLLLLVK